VGWAGFAAAQEERPEITPGERKVPRKKDAGPRAVALLQMGANGKVSLVPIAILIDGKFWDASAYKADPVPMALDQGTVYEGERAGSSLGLFTVSSALHSRSLNSQTPWIATGKWVAAGSDTAKTEVKAETAPVGIDKSDEPPRLTRDPAKIGTPADAPSSKTAPASGPAPSSSTPAGSATSSSTQSSGQSGSGDEPPRLKKGSSTAPEAPPTGSSGPATSDGAKPDSKNGDTKAGDSKPADAKPTDAKPTDAKADDHVNVPASDSGASEANRPRLRRGKPVEALPDDDVPGYSKPGAAGAAATPSATAADAAKAAQAKADVAPVDLVSAISDATGPEARSYVFTWIKGEEEDRREQMVALAKQKVRAYVLALAKATMRPGAQAAPHGASAKPAAKM
jgi:hypothetical protein